MLRLILFGLKSTLTHRTKAALCKGEARLLPSGMTSAWCVQRLFNVRVTGSLLYVPQINPPAPQTTKIIYWSILKVCKYFLSGHCGFLVHYWSGFWHCHGTIALIHTVQVQLCFIACLIWLCLIHVCIHHYMYKKKIATVKMWLIICNSARSSKLTEHFPSLERINLYYSR